MHKWVNYELMTEFSIFNDYLPSVILFRHFVILNNEQGEWSTIALPLWKKKVGLNTSRLLQMGFQFRTDQSSMSQCPIKIKTYKKRKQWLNAKRKEKALSIFVLANHQCPNVPAIEKWNNENNDSVFRTKTVLKFRTDQSPMSRCPDRTKAKQETKNNDLTLSTKLMFSNFVLPSHRCSNFGKRANQINTL